MADIDLDGYSLDELRALEKEVQKAISSFETRKKKELLRAARAMAAKEGYTLADLFDTSKQTRVKKTVPPRYRHPDDATLTWTGRGRTPVWLKEAEAAGRDRQEFAIG